MFDSCGLDFGNSTFFNSGHSMFLGGGIFRVIFLIIIVILIVSIFRNAFLRKTENFRGEKNHDYMEILKMRYVNGEITKEEYQEIKQKLKD